MKVTDHIAQAKDTLVSFEILPPLKGKTINTIYNHLDPLMEFKPSFINVTYHRSETMFKKKADGTFEKVEVRKRPGTVAQLVIKYDWYDPNAKVKSTDIGKAGTTLNATDIKYSTLGFGYVYYISENLKLVLWYDKITNEKTQLPAYIKDLKDDVFTCRLQFRF